MAGDWQGTLAGKLRTIVKITKAGRNYKAEFYSIDQGRAAIPITSITLDGQTLKYASPAINGSYEGQLSADGQSIKGVWTQNGRSTPLDLARATPATAWAIDPTPHKVQFVTTDDHVKLEVLDWGGTGRPLVFVPGLGADAHVFDKFAPLFIGKYHVYGVSRRGYGASDKPDPATGAVYTADRLADDVLAAMDALKIDRPVLAAWSLGGEEISSIATRKPDRVAGLVYLDAAYAYAFYAPGNLTPVGSNLIIDLNDMRAKVDRIERALGDRATPGLLDELMAVDLPQFQTDLSAIRQMLAKMPAPPPGLPPPNSLDGRIGQAIMAGEQKYTALKTPTLAIYASPHALPPGMPDAQKAAMAAQDAVSEDQIKRFEAANPKATVIRIAGAQHGVFASNPDQVAKAMNAFMDQLK